MTAAGVSAPSSFALEIEGLDYAYRDQKVLSAINLSVRRGELVALLGPSGCGKTTLLNLIAGLLRASAGTIRINGAVAADGREKVFMPPEQRGLGMVFQDYALWPHMTIGRNVAFPLEMRGVSRSERRARVSQALTRVGLEDLENRMPSELSGGQQQRAAVARAIVGEPCLVLFDEPLSNLDRELRESLAEDLSALIRKLGLTAVYVTHDQSEAFMLADRIVVMRKGRIKQDASPEDLVKRPADPETAAFLDLGALAHVDRCEDGWRLRGTELRLRPSEGLNGMDSTQILIPRHAASLANPEESELTGTIVRATFRPGGYTSVVRLDLRGPEVTAAAPVGHRPAIGDRVGIRLDTSALRWFPAEAE